MTEKLNIRTLAVSFFAITLLITNLITPITANAAEVSSGDAEYGIMTLSEEDYGISTANLYYQNAVEADSKSLFFRPSFYQDNFTLSLPLFELNLSNTSAFGHGNNFVAYINANISFDLNGTIYPLSFFVDESTIEFNVTDYNFWILYKGQKYSIPINYGWIDFTIDHAFDSAIAEFGIDIHCQTLGSPIMGEYFAYDSLTQSYQASAPVIRGCTYNLIVDWSTFEYDIVNNGRGTFTLLNSIITWLSDITSNIQVFGQGIISNIQSYGQSIIDKFDELFKKIDDDQEELINGYDSTENDSAASTLGSTIDNLEENEAQIKDQAFENINEYTVPESDGIASYATQFATVFPLIASMMQSIYTQSDGFGIIISIAFTLTIASMLIGLFRFYKN